jgi:hypothetical protein
MTDVALRRHMNAVSTLVETLTETLAEEVDDFPMKIAVLLADQVGADYQTIPPGSSVPWGNDYMGGQGYILTMPDWSSVPRCHDRERNDLSVADFGGEAC